jgi:hypothetical protein
VENFISHKMAERISAISAFAIRRRTAKKLGIFRQISAI